MGESSLILFFGIGIVALITFQYATGLHRFNGTMLMTRMYYRVAVSMFLTIAGVFLFGWKIDDFGKSAVTGILLSIPFWFHSKRSLDKRMEGTKVIYTRKPHSQFLKSEVLSWMFAACFAMVAYQVPWAVGGLGMGWILSEIYTMAYVEKLENELGAPIMEERR